MRRPFAEHVATVLIGVAIRRGDDWQDIQAKSGALHREWRGELGSDAIGG